MNLWLEAFEFAVSDESGSDGCDWAWRRGVYVGARYVIVMSSAYDTTFTGAVGVGISVIVWVRGRRLGVRQL